MNPNGRISPAGLLTVAAGDSLVFAIEPDDGYHVSRLVVDGRKVSAATRYVLRGVRSRRTIAAEFEVNTYPVVTTAGPNGSISPARPPAVPHGDRLRLNIVPREGYHLDSLLVDGVVVRPRNALVLRNITSRRRVSATFAPNEYLLTVSAGVHAAISPSGVIAVKHGQSQTFTFGADSGYAVCELLVDDVPVRVGASYTLTNVRANHRLVARTSHPVANVLAPQVGEVWALDEVHEILWEPLGDALADSGVVQVSFHGLSGPWVSVWRGLFREGKAQWKVGPLTTDSLMVSVVRLANGTLTGMDLAPGPVRVVGSQRSTDGSPFYVRSVRNPATRPVPIDFSLPTASEATLEIYSLSGRQVWRQSLGNPQAGRGNWTWEGQVVGGGLAAPGVYFVRLVTTHGAQQCRLVLLR